MDEARRASERLAARGDGAAWWVAQLRSGAISRADLELAAWVGDEDARQALGPSVLTDVMPSESAWSDRLRIRIRNLEPTEGSSRPGARTCANEPVSAWEPSRSDCSRSDLTLI